MAAEPQSPLEAMNAILREASSADEIQTDFAGFLRRRGIEGADLRAMLATGAPRFLVYRTLVHNRFRKTIRAFTPRTIARLGASRFEQAVAGWMDERGPRSLYLRDVPAEFVAWVCPRWQQDAAVPDYLPDLARHELLDLDVRNDPRGGEALTELPLDLDRRLRFDGTARWMAYDFAVHQLPSDEDDRSEPTRIATRLLVYRDTEGEPRYLDLTVSAASILHALLVDQCTLETGLRRACDTPEGPLPTRDLAAAAELFADLASRRVLLGAEPH